MYQNIIGSRLRELRGNSSQSEMASPVGIKWQAWARYERGEVAPGAEILATICRVHRCSSDWLLGLSDKASPYVITTGNNSPIVSGQNNSVSLGESWQCSKCPFKKKLKAVEKFFNQTFNG